MTRCGSRRAACGTTLADVQEVRPAVRSRPWPGARNPTRGDQFVARRVVVGMISKSRGPGTVGHMTDVDEAVLTDLISREPLFHRTEFGTSREVFESMTMPDFWEVGASGAVYDREFVWATLERRYVAAEPDEWETSDFRLRPAGRRGVPADLCASTGLEGHATRNDLAAFRRSVARRVPPGHAGVTGMVDLAAVQRVSHNASRRRLAPPSEPARAMKAVEVRRRRARRASQGALRTAPVGPIAPRLARWQGWLVCAALQGRSPPGRGVGARCPTRTCASSSRSLEGKGLLVRVSAEVDPSGRSMV